MARLLKMEGAEVRLVAMVEPPEIQNDPIKIPRPPINRADSAMGRASILNEIILASRAYAPRKYPGEILLLCARDSMSGNRVKQWQEIADAECCIIAGDHMSCVGARSTPLCIELKSRLLEAQKLCLEDGSAV